MVDGDPRFIYWHVLVVAEIFTLVDWGIYNIWQMYLHVADGMVFEIICWMGMPIVFNSETRGRNLIII